jgi:hypothetical protein
MRTHYRGDTTKIRRHAFTALGVKVRLNDSSLSRGPSSRRRLPGEPAINENLRGGGVDHRLAALDHQTPACR